MEDGYSFGETSTHMFLERNTFIAAVVDRVVVVDAVSVGEAQIGIVV